MADTKASNISVSITDVDGYKSNALAYADFGAADTVAGITTALEAWLQLLNNVTGGKINSCEYKMAIPITSGAASKTALAGAFNARVLSIDFTNSQDKAAWAFDVPAVDPAAVTSGGPIMTESGSIDLLADFMETNPITGTTGGVFTTSRDGALVLGFNGRIVTHKHRKQLQSGSRRTGI